MVLIYTHKVTKRFSYVMKHIFGRILNIDVDFTTKVEEFVRHEGPKFTYSKQPLQNEFFVRSNDLLFERGINDFHIKVSKWDEIPCFFETSERSDIPFDIFSASFFMLSRYEEYLPHVKDDYGRYKPHDSVAYQNKFLRLPVVDLWAFKFISVLKKHFPELSVSKKKYRFKSIINVSVSHKFAHRGFLRSFFGVLGDITSLRFLRMKRRIAVWFKREQDPFDNYFELIEIQKKTGVSNIFFFQFADYSSDDKNVSIHKNSFRFLIKNVADYCQVSLSASHASSRDINILKEEKKRLSELINRPINRVRLRYNRVNVPESYRSILEAEFSEDFSMGYTHEIGFRAGTCTPFFYYDVLLEVQQPLKVHPFVACDFAFLKYKEETKVLEDLTQLNQLVRQVGGEFNVVFSNKLLGSKHRINWKNLYQSILKAYHD